MRIYVSIFLLIMFGCKSTTIKTNEVFFQTASKGVLFGDEDELVSQSNISFTNAKDWKSFIEKINVPNTFSKVTIDFSKQQLLCVFDTIRNTSGFIIEIENERIILEYLGYEKKRDQINFYMNMNNDLKNKSINIQNSVLFNSFPDQKNIILFRYLLRCERNSVSNIFFLKINFLPNFYS